MAFVRKEWGSVTFVLTVIVGMIVVPVALYFANVGPGAVTVPKSIIVSSARASGAASPAPSPTPTKKATPTPTH